MAHQRRLTLYQFPISHYCEKARWALDYKNAFYRSINLAPGLHRMIIKRKAPAAKNPITVPALLVGDELIQGSGEIIDYLDRVLADMPLGFAEPELRKESAELEIFLDESIAKPLRAIAYNALLNDRRLLIERWSRDCPFYARAWLAFAMPYLTRVLERMYQTGNASLPRHKDRFNAGMDRLDRLCESRPYLVGDRFSRTDLTMAAFLAPLRYPEQHPFSIPIPPPDEFGRFCESHSHRPALKRTAELYQIYRSKR